MSIGRRIDNLYASLGLSGGGGGTPFDPSNLQSQIDNTTSSLATETSRALAAESDLDGKITTETSRAVGIESSLQNQITAEVARATSAENGLAESINALGTEVITSSVTNTANGPLSIGANASVLNLGTSAGIVNIGVGVSSGVINIGSVGDTVNLLGTVTTNNVTSSTVTDKTIKLNVGGGAATAAGSGIEIEEAGAITGYMKVSSDRSGFTLKAPGGSVLTLNQSVGTTATPNFSSVTAGSFFGTASSALTSNTCTTIPSLGGEATSVGNSVTLNNDSVIGKTLTGYVKVPGVVSAADSLLSSIQKVDGNSLTFRGQFRGGSNYFPNDIVFQKGGIYRAKIGLAGSANPTIQYIFSQPAPVSSIIEPLNAVIGLSFRPLVNGFITAIMFYKYSTNTLVGRAGRIWTSTGTLLGGLTFSAESSSGWQTGYLATPITVAGNNTYVVSVGTRVQHEGGSIVSYPIISPVSGPNLTAIGSTKSTGLLTAFPGLSSGTPNTNYYVDVLFQESADWDTVLPPPFSQSTATLSGDVTSSASGFATVVNVGGKTASSIASSVDLTTAATNVNTANALVKRDGSGNVIVNEVGASAIRAPLFGTATAVECILEANNQGNLVMKIDGNTELNGDCVIKNGASLRLQNVNNDRSIGFRVPSGMAGNSNYILPSAVGSAGQVLSAANGTGAMTWTTPAAIPVIPTVIDPLERQLNGFTPVVGVVSDNDTILSAIQKLDGNVTLSTLGAINAEPNTLVRRDALGNTFSTNVGGTRIVSTEKVITPMLEIRDPNIGGTVRFVVPSISQNTTYELPPAQGSAGQILTALSGGALTWTTPSAGVDTSTLGTSDPDPNSICKRRSTGGCSFTDVIASTVKNVSSHVLSTGTAFPCPGVANNIAEFASLSMSNGGCLVDMDIVVDGLGFSNARHYTTAISYNSTVGLWRRLIPVKVSIDSASQDFEIHIRVINAVTRFRLKRLAGSNPATVQVKFNVTGDNPNLTFFNIVTSDANSTLYYNDIPSLAQEELTASGVWGGAFPLGTASIYVFKTGRMISLSVTGIIAGLSSNVVGIPLTYSAVLPVWARPSLIADSNSQWSASTPFLIFNGTTSSESLGVLSISDQGLINIRPTGNTWIAGTCGFTQNNQTVTYLGRP